MNPKLMKRNVLAAVLLAASTALPAPAQTPLIDQGRAAIRRGDTERAIALLERAVRQTPRSAEAHYYLAGAYGRKAQSGGMIAGARYASKVKAEFEKAVAINPRYVEARFGLVQFYAVAPGLMGGSYDKALEHARAILAVDPVLGHRARSFVYSQQKKPELARKEYVDAIREHPESAKARGYFGQYLANVEKNYPAALAELEAALKLDASYMAAFYHLGRTAALGNVSLPRGEEALTRYLAYTPTDNEPPHAAAHYYLGAIYEKQGKKTEARRRYQTALRLDPSMKQAAEALKRMS